MLVTLIIAWVVAIAVLAWAMAIAAGRADARAERWARTRPARRHAPQGRGRLAA